tara:strand:+ start:679 stop:1158 length:480 start_codon:yes stop_codon:yes gene_type:complete
MIKFNKIKTVVFDFDGVFTDNRVYVDENGIESVCCYRSDGIGISRIKKLGISVYIVSTETNKVVTARAKKLNIKCYQNIESKDLIVKEISNNTKVPLDQICFLGNDINDLPALKIVGFPMGVNDSFLEIETYIKYKTKNKGGHGAVRELCDLIYNSYLT